jgi:hypothetical protein
MIHQPFPSSRTYIMTTIGYTAVVFTTGTLAWWMPGAVDRSWAVQHNVNVTDVPSDTRAK